MGTLTDLAVNSQDHQTAKALNPCNLLGDALGGETTQSQDLHLQGEVVLDELLLGEAFTEQGTIFRGKKLPQDLYLCSICALHCIFPMRKWLMMSWELISERPHWK